MKKKQKRIVLLEDEPTIANLIDLGLKKQGYAVQAIRNGKEGLRIIRKTKPDLVLLDMMLPGMRGFDILEALYAEHTLPSLPVIIISNSGQPIEIERALNLGVRDYLIKVNFTPQEVIEKVEHLFASKTAKPTIKKKSKKSGEGKRVLIVEDDFILAETLEKKFIQKNHYAQKALNASEARRILQNTKIDVILLDLILPDVDGFSFLSELKHDNRFKDIPIVIISNLGQREDMERGLRGGAIDYIVKANTVPGEIVERVEALLKNGSVKK